MFGFVLLYLFGADTFFDFCGFAGQLVSSFALADHFTNGINYGLGLVDLYVVPAALDDRVRTVR